MIDDNIILYFRSSFPLTTLCIYVVHFASPKKYIVQEKNKEMWGREHKM